jgi:hypothetical protein
MTINNLVEDVNQLLEMILSLTKQVNLLELQVSSLDHRLINIENYQQPLQVHGTSQEITVTSRCGNGCKCKG